MLPIIAIAWAVLYDIDKMDEELQNKGSEVDGYLSEIEAKVREAEEIVAQMRENTEKGDLEAEARLSKAEEVLLRMKVQAPSGLNWMKNEAEKMAAEVGQMVAKSKKYSEEIKAKGMKIR